MGFWVFMLVMEVLMPFMVIAFGYWFKKSPPGQINSVFGYRTKMSMKNMDTWKLAHQYCGVLWCRIGWITLPVTVAAMLPLIGQNENVVGSFGSVIMTVQLAVLFGLPILMTEKELRRRFDADGNQKKL